MQQFLNGLRHDVFNDVMRGVIDPAGFADFGFFLDGHTPALRTNDLAEKSLVNRAENFDRDVAEEIRRFFVAQIRNQPGEPVIADDEFFAEMRLEKIAVEKWNVRRRPPVQGAEVPNDAAPEGSFGCANAAVTEVRGRFFVEFKRLLMRPRAV